MHTGTTVGKLRASCLFLTGLGCESEGLRGHGGGCHQNKLPKGPRSPLEGRALRAMCRDIPERQRAKPSQFRRLIWSPSRWAANSKVQTSCEQRSRKGK